MKYFKLIIAVLVGLFVITMTTELIEFSIVKLVSGLSFEELQANQIEYFNVRNKTWILISKMFYALLSGFVGGYLCTWISQKIAKMAVILLIIIQEIALIWAGFISDLSATGPVWMWIYLLIFIPFGIWLGYKWKIKS